jgi:flagellar biosynthesis/type III secretory pathway protein FliH
MTKPNREQELEKEIEDIELNGSFKNNYFLLKAELKGIREGKILGAEEFANELIEDMNSKKSQEELYEQLKPFVQKAFDKGKSEGIREERERIRKIVSDFCQMECEHGALECFKGCLGYKILGNPKKT